MTIKVGEPYIEQNATAIDNKETNITDQIIITGSIDTNTIGAYFITYTVTDGAANISHAMRRVEVISMPDTTAPSITLNGDASISLTLGDTYTELNATATDHRDGNLSNAITITGKVDTNTVGSYTLIYTVKDGAGNMNQTQRSVQVVHVADTIAPVVILNGESNISLVVGDSYIEYHATATDNEDNNLSQFITISGSVDTNTVGDYSLTYTVNDGAGNVGKAVRTIHVIDLADIKETMVDKYMYQHLAISLAKDTTCISLSHRLKDLS